MKWLPKISCTLPPLKFSQVVGLEGWTYPSCKDLSRSAAIYGFIFELYLIKFKFELYVHKLQLQFTNFRRKYLEVPCKCGTPDHAQTWVLHPPSTNARDRRKFEPNFKPSKRGSKKLKKNANLRMKQKHVM